MDTDLSLGRELRRAREVRGIGLDQIARETRIAERYLQALESDRVDLLPGEVYARNFVRSYARCLGADEEELLDYLDYQVRRQAEVAPARPAPGVRQRRVLAVAGLAVALAIILGVVALSLLRRSGTDPAPAPATRAGATSASPARTLPPAPAASEGSTASRPATGEAPSPAGAADGGGQQPQPEAELRPPAPPPVLAGLPAPAAPPPPVPEAPSDDEPPATAAEPAAGVQDPAVPPAAPEDAVPVVQLVFEEESWIEAHRETGDPTFGIQPSGSTLTFELDEPLDLMIGNAGVVTMLIDGQPAKPLGARGESRRLALDRRNYRSYL